jgi:hypothetical protein
MEYEHLMLRRQRQQQLESQTALRHSTALGTSLIAAGRMLQSL